MTLKYLVLVVHNCFTFLSKVYRRILEFNYLYIPAVGRVAQSVYRLGYGLDGPGIESRWGEFFRPSRQALASNQPPVQWVPGLTRG